MTQIIDLGKLRFSFAGEWSASTTYETNDVVKYGGNVYVYTYGLKTSTQLPTNTIYWALMVQGIKFTGVYNSATAYKVGDGIAYGGKVYIAVADTTGNIPPNLTYWSQFADGIQYEGTFSNSTQYQKNDIVQYGPSAYIAKQDTTGNNPTNGTFWDKLVEGVSASGVWNASTAYVPGDLIAYGANQYKATANNTNQLPIDGTGVLNSAYWQLFNSGIRSRGDWGTATEYFINDVVSYGGNTFICVVRNASTVFATDLAASKWAKFNSGIRARGNWTTGASYLVNDIVTTGVGSAYIALTDHTAASFADDLIANRWLLLAAGGAGVLPIVPANSEGKSLSVAANNATLYWANASGADNVLYVAKNGSDTNNGKSLAQPFASLQKAVSMVPSGQKTAIFVKSGTYAEAALPIVVPPNTAIIGDSTRTTIVTPATGFAANGTTPNAQSTMFLVSDGSLMNKMTFQGMTGWTAGTTPADISTSTPKGVFFALNPASPITTKSPYIVECTSISSGGIGAYVNGSVHTTGNKSMLFHEYTLIEDNGVGLWVDNNGKSEAVSVFTYFCYFGYATTNGGQIRSLSGNNSYGNYGTFSSGFDASETAVTGSVFGSMITLTGAYSGIINIGDTITSSSGATAVVTNAQATTLYVTSITGTFAATNTLTASSGGQAVVSTIGGQSGFTLVLNNLTAAPAVGGSIQVAGDTSAYVIQATSGGWANTASVITVVLAQQKPTASVSGSTVSIRYNFSLLRVTGHDFLNVGTGGILTTNYPGTPTQPPVPSQQVAQVLPGRIYYVSTDQSGNFAVGSYFAVNQATGAATLNANSFNLSGLTSLRLGSIGAQLGAQINEFSTDVTMSQNSPVKVPTQSAVVGYVGTYVPSQTGNAGKVLQTNGTTTSWATVSVTPQWITKTADYTAVAGNNLFCNTAAGPFTITMPATASNNDSIRIVDPNGTFAFSPVTVKYNGASIQGLSDNLILNAAGSSITLTYNSSFGWRLV